MRFSLRFEVIFEILNILSFQKFYFILKAPAFNEDIHRFLYLKLLIAYLIDAFIFQ